MIKYIVNEEKRTVVAMIEFNEYEETFRDSDWLFESVSRAYAILRGYDFNSTKSYHKLDEKMFFPRYMSAKAKCDPRDEWDVEYGKALAKQRLVEKIKKYRSDSYKIVADMVNKVAELLNR